MSFVRHSSPEAIHFRKLKGVAGRTMLVSYLSKFGIVSTESLSR